MANCTACGVKVGCGCQLVNGMCSACNHASKQIKRFKNDVIAKAYKLYRKF